MSIANFFINRPVFATVINLVIGVLGLVCFSRISIRETPNVEKKIVIVEMEYPGASVEIMESQIASRIEESLSNIEGITDMTSSIQQGMTRTRLEFDASKNIDTAANDVESRLRRIKGDLPDNLREPTISKGDQVSTAPSFSLALYGGNYNTSQLGDQMVRYVKNSVESISGVASVSVSGQTGTPTTYAIDVFMKPQLMAPLNVTPEDIFRAVSVQSFIQPAGDVTLGNTTYRMTVRAGLKTLPEFENIIVRERQNKIVRLKDVAEVKLNNEEDKVRVKYNGQNTANAYIYLKPDANVIDIAKRLEEKLKEIRQSLPDRELKLEIGLDTSIRLKASIERLLEATVEAIILVALIVLLFLKSFRATIIPIVTIPVCLLSGFIFMYYCGFTINNLTILALLLAVGLVVDDAIVVIERIVENVEHHQMTPLNAAIKGIQEIQGSVVGMTLTLVSVYLPLALTPGSLGRVLREFGISLAGMVLMSGVVAFILTPMMSARLLKSTKKKYRVLDWFNNSFELLKNQYRKSLDWALDHKLQIILSAILIGLSSIYVAKYLLISEAEPETDRNIVFVTLSSNRAGLDVMAPVISSYEEIAADPSIKSVISSFSEGSDRANIYLLLLDDPTKRKSAKEIRDMLKDKYDARFAEFLPSVTTPTVGSSGKTFDVTVKTNKSYDELEIVAGEVVQALRYMKKPYVAKNIRVSRIKREKTYNIVPNRDRCYLVGARLEDVRNAIRYIMRGNPPADRYERDGKQYPVRVWTSEEDRKNLEIVKEFMIRTNRRSDNREDYDLVSMRDLVDIQVGSVRPLMQHEFSQKSYSIGCEFEGKDVDFLKAYNELESKALKILPPGYTISPGSDVKNLAQENRNLAFTFLISFILLYLVMAAVFESFLDPLIVISSVPLALSWAILTLKAFPDGSLNYYSQLGFLTLIGLITKHGILLVDFFNTKFQETKSLKVAAIESALERFRPIVMTTLAMVLGAVPLILKKGSGHEAPKQIGIVLVGGLTFGTIMTIFVVPCLCVIFKQLQKRLFGQRLRERKI
jgi:multidrug efflux pump